MERESPQQYDVLALDAFSSDAIPLHLLTREAFDLYLRHLRPDGVLAVHVSNQHLDLRPVVRDQAAAHQVPARLVASWPEPFDAISGATWVLLCRDPEFFRLPDVRDAGEPLPAQPFNLRLWTDDYSNLFQILKAR